MQYDNFKHYLESEYDTLREDYYVCMGNHVWHISNIHEEYERLLKEQIATLESQIDQYYAMSDDHGYWRKQEALRVDLKALKAQLLSNTL